MRTYTRYYYNLFTRETQNVYAVFEKLKKPKVERDLQEKEKNTWKLEEALKKKILMIVHQKQMK